MQRRLQTKVNDFFNTFKQEFKIKYVENPDQVLQFVFDYSNLELTKEDFQKRKRVKNNVPWHERCKAFKAECIQCTRRRKDGEDFCGTHLKGQPHGVVSQGEGKEEEFLKITIWSEEIDGIIYHMDNNGNIYDPQDIHENCKNPKIIAKYEKNSITNKYTILK